MNPFILLLGLVGASGLGSLKKDAEVTGHKSPDKNSGKKTDEETVQQDTPVDVIPVEDPVVEPVEEPVEVPVEDPLEDPVIEDPVNETPATPPEGPDQPGDGGDDPTLPPVIADGTIDVVAGRVATLSAAGDDVTDVRIVSGVEHGTLTINPDNSLALVMTLSDFTGSQSFTYEATHSDGSTSLHDVDLNVSEGLQEAGWGTGSSHYMLETDADDDVIVEHGDVHQKVYISGADDALTKADLADMYGLTTADITGDWLAAHDYGSSEDSALAKDAGMELWHEVSGRNSETSNWLLFERGYEYSELEHPILDRATSGESELHPLYVGAWGEGDRPIIGDEITTPGQETENVVLQGLHFTEKVTILHADNILLDDVVKTETGFSVQHSTGVTIRNSDVYDVIKEEPSSNNTTDSWQLTDRTTALYANYNDGLLLEGNFFDHTGWGEGYTGSLDDPQAPGKMSHNIYIDNGNVDVTMRDTISMRAASWGSHVRSGGFLEDNVYIDNNAGFTIRGGDYYGEGAIGNYSLVSGTLITSGAHKVADEIGYKAAGLEESAWMTSYVDNIIAHLADPNNPDEQAEKEVTNYAMKLTNDPYYDDTIVWNWMAQTNQWMENDKNYEGLDTNVLDQTTIQLFAAELLGNPDATIADLADYLRAQSDGTFEDIVDADLIAEFFRSGFGIETDTRFTAETLRFVPNDLGDGVRWDNRLNWDTEDLPGTVAGDSVDLGGNHVIFGGNADIDALELGDGGHLEVHNGKLTVAEGLTTAQGAGELDVAGSGQFWTEGHSGEGLDIDVSGGRFANTGHMSDASLTATGGQTILASDDAEFDLVAGQRLALFDAAAKMGFDGEAGGMAILDMHEGSTLEYSAQNGDIGTIEEFRSGAFGDSPDVLSGIDLGDATLEIDLSGLTADQASAFTLMDADELVGLFDTATLDIGGLGARDAKVVVDYLDDSVRLELTAGTGQVSVETLGDETDHEADNEALWNILMDVDPVSAAATIAAADMDEAPTDDEDLLLAS